MEHWPIALAFIKSARRHGLELRYDDLHNRVIHVITEHVLMLVDGEEESASNLLYSINPLVLVGLISETFISHLASNPTVAPLRELWVE